MIGENDIESYLLFVDIKFKDSQSDLNTLELKTCDTFLLYSKSQ